MFNNLLYEFLDHFRRKKYKKHTLHDYNTTLSVFLKFMKDNYPDLSDITDVSRDMIVNYEKYLVTKEDARGKTMSRSRRKRYLLNLRTFFNFLVKDEKIYKNPAVNLAIPREKKRIIKDVLTVDEMDKLLKSCDGVSLKDLRDRAILELLYSSGVRAAELCGIEINDIDLDEKMLFIRKGKFDKQRMIPFGDSASYWVKKYIERARPLMNDTGLVLLFVSVRGNKLDPKALREIVKVYANFAGINKKVTTHTFRHTCATHMLKGNADIRYVQKQLGHKRISTTEMYLKVDISDLKEVHERCHPREQDDW